MLLVAAEGNRPVRRRYTIRQLDAPHGCSRWTSCCMATVPASAGAVCPVRRQDRGHRAAREDHHVGRGRLAPVHRRRVGAARDVRDDRGCCRLDRPATLVLEIPEESDEQDLAAGVTTRISWLHRLGAPAGDPSALAAEAAEIELLPGRGHAYLFGEATVVSRLREVLAERGLGQDQISPKAYWGRGRANASHGEPARSA
jgi:hypothetical protein